MSEDQISDDWVSRETLSTPQDTQTHGTQTDDEQPALAQRLRAAATRLPVRDVPTYREPGVLAGRLSAVAAVLVVSLLAAITVARIADRTKGERTIFTGRGALRWARNVVLTDSLPKEARVDSLLTTRHNGARLLFAAVSTDPFQLNSTSDVWRSTDGAAFERVLGPVDATNLALTELPDGRIIAAGLRGGWFGFPGTVADQTSANLPPRVVEMPAGFDPSKGAIGFDPGDSPAWVTNAEKTSWTELTSVPAGLTRVVVVNDQILGLGHSGAAGDLQTAVWASDDLLTWKKVSSDDTSTFPPGCVCAAVTLDGQQFLLGHTSDRPWGSASDGLVWRSADGRAWELVPDVRGLQGAMPTSVVANSDVIVAIVHVGESTTSTKPNAQEPATAGSSVAAPPTATVIRGGNVERFMSECTTGSAPPRSEVMACMVEKLRKEGSLGRGLLAIPQRESELRVSTDGVSWQRVTDSDLAGARLQQLTMLGDEFLALGIGATGQFTAWLSNDGVAWQQTSSEPPNVGADASDQDAVRVVPRAEDPRDLAVAVGNASSSVGATAIWTVVSD